ncbi:hypothetical protein StoSoilB13_21730 [Arthrobacter sp. StoSoilB13]|nr:hypothetical protein StoSoilB13_21730 [Arthrobacter sp. StoSoilB13]
MRQDSSAENEVVAAFQLHAVPQELRVEVLRAMPHPAGPLAFQFTNDAGQLTSRDDAGVGGGLPRGRDSLYGCAVRMGGEQQIHGFHSALWEYTNCSSTPLVWAGLSTWGV